MICVQTGGKRRIACLRVERHAANCVSATRSGEMFIPPDTWLPAGNYALARNATFSTNFDTKRRVYLERHDGDVTRVNTALPTLRRVHFTLVTIATMPPLVCNLLLFGSDFITELKQGVLSRARCAMHRSPRKVAPAGSQASSKCIQ